MPNNHIPEEVVTATPQEAREEAQLLLANIHGLMWLTIQGAEEWNLPSTKDAKDNEPQLTLDDLQRAVEAGHERFGAVQAALSTGQCDDQIRRVGIGGPEGRAKKNGFMSALGRYLKAWTGPAVEKLAALKECLKWGKIVVGSIASAIPKEIEKVHGASFAAEGIGELLDVLQGAAETAEKRIDSSSQSPAGGACAKTAKQENNREEKSSTQS